MVKTSSASAEDEIIKYAKDKDVDLIVLGTNCVTIVIVDKNHNYKYGPSEAMSCQVAMCKKFPFMYVKSN
jgi:hypothetical protein